MQQFPQTNVTTYPTAPPANTNFPIQTSYAQPATIQGAPPSYSECIGEKPVSEETQYQTKP